MDPKYLPDVAFVAIASILFVVFLVLRDIFSKGEDEGASRRIEPLAVPSELPARSAVGRFDRWFDRLVLESGYGFTSTAAFLAALSGGLLLGGWMFLWRDSLLMAGIGLLVGMVVVIAIFAWMRARRLRRMQEELPDTIELLARAVRAGETLDQAIALVGQTVAAPLGPEFRRCARHLEMGLAMEAALRSLARRVPLYESRILAATLSVQRRTGGSLPTTLERLARVIRDRLSYQRQFRAATAAGRTSTFLMTAVAILVLLYLLIGRPDYLPQFLESTAGKVMLAIAAVLQIVGLVWIARLLRPDY